MSTQTEKTPFEAPGTEAVLSSDLGGEPPFVIHGVAIGADDVTRGRSGIRKVWPGDELADAADSLESRPLVKNHTNDVEGVVGEVTKAKYKKGVGVLYEAELDERDLAEKVANGRLEVSPRILHTPVDELEEDEELDAVVVEGMRFDNLSIVTNGASPSNTVDIGEHEELSPAELAAEFGEEQSEGDDETHDASDELESESEPAEAVEGNEDGVDEELEEEEVDEELDEEVDDEVDEELDEESETASSVRVPLMHSRSADDPGQSVRAMIAEMSTTNTMTVIDIHPDDLPEEAEELGHPVLMEKDEYEELQEKAQSTEQKFDELQESLDELSDVREEKQELEERVEELEEKASEVDQVKQMYAEELAEGSPFEAEELKEAHDLQTLREKVDENEEEELEESDPEPRGEDVNEEELEEADGPDEETEQRIEELEEKREFYEKRGWEGPAEELAEELEELKQ